MGRPPPPGCAPGNVVTSIAGKPATSNIQLQELTLTKKPGDTVSIRYVRGGPVGHGDGHAKRPAVSSADRGRYISTGHLPLSGERQRLWRLPE